MDHYIIENNMSTGEPMLVIILIPIMSPSFISFYFSRRIEVTKKTINKLIFITIIGFIIMMIGLFSPFISDFPIKLALLIIVTGTFIALFSASIVGDYFNKRRIERLINSYK